jgi:hypothetical protein
MTHPSRSLSRRMSVGVQSDPTKLCATQNGGFGRGSAQEWPLCKIIHLSITMASAIFGTISVVVPPLRGPDEIAHFLRIYSYARGGLLPAAEVDGRKGIFIERDLYAQLAFFKNARVTVGYVDRMLQRFPVIVVHSPNV